MARVNPHTTVPDGEQIYFMPNWIRKKRYFGHRGLGQIALCCVLSVLVLSFPRRDNTQGIRLLHFHTENGLERMGDA